MLIRVVLLAFLALGLAGFGTVAWLDLHPTTHGPTKMPVEKLLAVARSLPAGSLIQPSDFAAAPAPADPGPGVIADTAANRSAYTGAMVRHSLPAGGLIHADAVIRPGDHGFLAAVLQPGMRAVSVGVDAITGAAGLIWPGDRVDLLLTQNLSAPNLPPGRRVAAETVLSDVRVIAIDQRLVQGASAGSKALGPARTVTLEVTPEQAERVEVAAHLGPLSMVVRSATRFRPNEIGDVPAPIYGGQVSPVLADLSGGHRHSDVMTIYQGPTDRVEYRP